MKNMEVVLHDVTRLQQSHLLVDWHSGTRDEGEGIEFHVRMGPQTALSLLAPKTDSNWLIPCNPRA